MNSQNAEYMSVDSGLRGPKGVFNPEGAYLKQKIVSELIPDTNNPILTVTIIGKSDPRNGAVLAQLLASIVRTGVERPIIFKIGVVPWLDVMTDAGLEHAAAILYHPDMKDGVEGICRRMAGLLTTDIVWCLPVMGSMSRSERNIAIEAGIPVKAVDVLLHLNAELVE